MNSVISFNSKDEWSIQPEKNGEDSTLKIQMAREEQWDEAMNLAWRVFVNLPDVAGKPDFTSAFNSFITDENLRRAFLLGNYQVILALEGEKVVGMLTLREPSHISLFFVEKSHQCRGIGREMLYALKGYMQQEMGASGVSVDAAPWAVGFYRKCGFVETGEYALRSGIKCVVMEQLF